MFKTGWLADQKRWF